MRSVAAEATTLLHTSAGRSDSLLACLHRFEMLDGKLNRGPLMPSSTGRRQAPFLHSKRSLISSLETR